MGEYEGCGHTWFSAELLNQEKLYNAFDHFIIVEHADAIKK